MDRPVYLELMVSIVLLIGILLVSFLSWALLGSAAVATIAGVPLGVLSGVLLLFVVFYAQLPRLAVDDLGEKHAKEYEQFYTHLKVTNTSWGFLGGGTAIDCRGEIEVAGKKYTPKWATRPEPMISTGRLVKVGEFYFPEGVPQDSMMEAAKSQDIGPGEIAIIDVAMKQRGDSNCFIHEPENYKHREHKHNPLPPGEYPFVLTLKCRNRQPVVAKGVISNGEGTEPDTLSVRLMP